MSQFVGEVVTLTAHATDALTGEKVTDLTGTVEFYAPGKDPENVPGDRTPDATSDAEYHYGAGLYVCYRSTVGFAAGEWTFKFALAGDNYSAWSYGTFTLDP